MGWHPRQGHWEEATSAARDFRAANGHLRVPHTYITADGFPLWTWLSSRRADHRRGRLSDERIAELDGLGMVWEPYEDDWRQGVAAARVFHATNGHLRVPRKFVTPDGLKLGMWVKTRRVERREGRLSEEHWAELDALDMVWDAHKKT